MSKGDLLMENLIKSDWINADLSRNEMKIFEKSLKKFLIQQIILKEPIIFLMRISIGI